MIHRIGLDRPDQTNFIGNTGGVGQNFAELHATLTMTFKLEF